MAECEPLLSAGNLDPSCEARKKRSGVNKRMYIGSLDDKPAITRDADGNITGITLPAGKYLRRVVGQKLLNSGSTGLTRSNSSVQFDQTVNFLAFFNTQKEKNTIVGFAKAEDLFIIVEQNDGMLDAYGLVADNGTPDGLEMTAFSHSTGTVDGDSTAATLTFTGSSDTLPVYCKLGVDTAAEIAVLEALVLPDPAPVV